MTNTWPDYQLLDSGNGRKLERFGSFILDRPEKDVSWNKQQPELWSKADAIFHSKTESKGEWKILTQVPDRWLMQYKDLKFWAKLTPYKHTGIFPEQASQWDWIQNTITQAQSKYNRPIKILNLFAYTGIATLAAAYAGAEVTHIDSSKPAINWFKDNQQASNLQDKPIRYIQEDAMKFINRELNRGNTYDGILMDPPVYGHGPKGEKWTFKRMFPDLLKITRKILSEQPLFVQVNTYTLSISLNQLKKDMAKTFTSPNGNIEASELTLEAPNQRPISPAIYARWAR